ncbi:patatin-like phospholipase family protein [Streptomyces phaeochromogenes]|uniref:patatin-like phospholipase family protein n=1 Tax=Streptomyces phaeochromogenes TaxID=1923 RepID=UPI0036C1D2E4
MDASEDEEILLALVMNGGVSLAVWMGGVTHEIDLLRRASDPDVTPSTVRESDQPMFERWRAACSASPGRPRRRVIVDVVAGTSAGGLNGTLLATAIARGTALDPAPEAGATGMPAAGSKLRKVWQDDAALQFDKLLPRPGTPPRPSILDGAFFAQAVDQVLQEIDGPVNPTGGLAAQSPPITLFVTATSTGPDARLYRDAYGNPLTCPDHRRVFRFQKQSLQYTYQAAL